jgi:hypothetical protein
VKDIKDIDAIDNSGHDNLNYLHNLIDPNNRMVKFNDIPVDERQQHCGFKTNQEILGVSKETNYQKYEILHNNFILDTHSTMHSIAPVFKPVEDNHFANSAKVDGFSKVMFLGYEIKCTRAGLQEEKCEKWNDFDKSVLAQCLERVLSTSNVCAFVSTFVIFGMTSSRSFVVIYKRSFSDTKELQLLNIIRISSNIATQFFTELSYHA